MIRAVDRPSTLSPRSTGLALLVLLALNQLPLPGLALLGVTPNWLLLGLVLWCQGRRWLTAVLAGVLVGLLQDALVASPYPSHALGLALVGYATVWMGKRWLWTQTLVGLMLVTPLLTLLSEGAIALQFLIRPDSLMAFHNTSASGGEFLDALSFAPEPLTQVAGVDPRRVIQPTGFLRGIGWDFLRIGLASGVITSLCMPLISMPYRAWLIRHPEG